MRRKRVVVLGGGITGLTCAWHLSRRGHEVSVYEKEPDFGGLCQTHRFGPFSFDYGPHEFCTDNPALLATLQTVLGPDLLHCRKHAAQYFRQSYIDYPLGPLELVREIHPLLLLRVSYEIFRERFRSLFDTTRDYSFRRWVECRFGPTLYQTYFGPYTEKVWGLDPESLDSRTASSRISFNSTFDFLLKTLRHTLFRQDDYSTIHSPLKSGFYYSRGGISRLCERLAEDCRQRGAALYPLHAAREIVIRHRRAMRVRFENGALAEDFDYMVSTLPLTHLLQSMGVREDMLPLRYRAMVFVMLETPRRPVSPYSWIYYPDRDISFQRLCEFPHIDPAMAPEGFSGLCAEISCFAGDDWWNASDESLIERVRSDLVRVRLLDADTTVRGHVLRHPFAYPIQVSGYLELVGTILAPIRRLHNLVTTGRQGLYKYCNMNECMEMAERVAGEIDAGTEAFSYPLGSLWRGAGLEAERILVPPSGHAPENTPLPEGTT